MAAVLETFFFLRSFFKAHTILTSLRDTGDDIRRQRTDHLPSPVSMRCDQLFFCLIQKKEKGITVVLIPENAG